MYTVTNHRKLPKGLPQDVKKAVSIAFGMEKYFDEAEPWGVSPAGTPEYPAMVIRLSRKPDSSTITAGVSHINEVGDLRDHMAKMHPGPMDLPVTGQHVGVVVTCDVWLGTEDLAYDLLTGQDNGTFGRIVVGLMTSRWSFEMFQRADGKRPSCQIAAPKEFGKLSKAMVPTLEGFNQRFSAWHRGGAG